MAKKLYRYTVFYNKERAKFTSYKDAFAFARLVRNSEISEKSGLIAQFDENGELTPEFAHLESRP